MRYLNIEKSRLDEAKQMHVDAVCCYVRRKPIDYQKELSDCISSVLNLGYQYKPGDQDFFHYLSVFLLLDVDGLKKIVYTKSACLHFSHFKNIYNNKFANGPDTFVDSSLAYNAYALGNKLDVKVCPYCDSIMIGVYKSGK